MKKGIKLLARLVLFTAVAVGTTYGMIRFELAKQQPKPEPAPVESGIDLNGTYNENDLLFTEVTEQVGDGELTYPQIDGLKDGEVEAAVNAMIAARVEEIKTDYAEGGSAISYLTYQIYANFSNVLSIGLFSADSDYNSRQDYLNINLNDGSLPELSDLFCTGADLQAVVRSAFYETLTRNNLSGNYWETVSAPDENELYKTVRGYLAGERAFAFSPTEIYFYYDQYAASVSMIDYAEDIAVYHRFLSEESLFERSDIGYKDIFTCAAIPKGYERRDYGMVGDNFWYDVGMTEHTYDAYVTDAVAEQVDAFANETYDRIMDEVQTLTQAAWEHPDRAYILLAQPYVFPYGDSDYVDGQWQSIPSTAVRISDGYMLYEMSFDLFETKYKDALIAVYRTDPYYLFYGGIDEYIVGDEVTVTKRNEERMALYASGTELSVETMFVAGYDYDAAIRAQAKYDLMSYYGCTLEEAELKAQTVTYTLMGGGLAVRVPEWELDQYLWMPLDDFSRDVLTIFQ